MQGFVLGVCLCASAFTVGGCCQYNNDPYLLVVSNTKTQFEIGEEFSLSDDMKIELVFENQERMELETPSNHSFVHDTINKIYTGLHYTIDYSEFDSSKGGSYHSFVDFIDQNEEERLLKHYSDECVFAIKEVHEIFQSLVGYSKTLEDSNSKILNKYLLEKIKKDYKKTIEFMSEFYNGDYQKVKEINEEITKKLNFSKR